MFKIITKFKEGKNVQKQIIRPHKSHFISMISPFYMLQNPFCVTEENTDKASLFCAQAHTD